MNENILRKLYFPEILKTSQLAITMSLNQLHSKSYAILYGGIIYRLREGGYININVITTRYSRDALQGKKY